MGYEIVFIATLFSVVSMLSLVFSTKNRAAITRSNEKTINMLREFNKLHLMFIERLENRVEKLEK